MPKVDHGWRLDKGWLFISMNTEVCAFHVAVGRLDIMLTHSKKNRDKRRKQRLESLSNTANYDGD